MQWCTSTPHIIGVFILYDHINEEISRIIVLFTLVTCIKYIIKVNILQVS